MGGYNGKLKMISFTMALVKTGSYGKRFEKENTW